jgi:hypothetical protein
MRNEEVCESLGMTDEDVAAMPMLKDLQYLLNCTNHIFTRGHDQQEEQEEQEEQDTIVACTCSGDASCRWCDEI